MSKAEILEALPRLKPDELQEIAERIWDLEEAQLLAGCRPTAGEKAMLDRELDEYRQDPQAGSSWEAVEARLRRPPVP
ncbi:MAG: hypothetical protein ABSF95_08335 [Verrucomicrobiota bacterium]|jgi:putative addiction module component (TIGR02574 family)